MRVAGSRPCLTAPLHPDLPLLGLTSPSLPAISVRRRRWIRTRVPIPPELNDPCRPLFLAWTVDVQPDGRTHLSVETT